MRLGESKEQYSFNFISICHIFLLGLIWWWTFACFILENYLGVANLCVDLQMLFNGIFSDQHCLLMNWTFACMSHQSSSYGSWSPSAGRLLLWVELSAHEIKMLYQFSITIIKTNIRRWFGKIFFFVLFSFILLTKKMQ